MVNRSQPTSAEDLLGAAEAGAHHDGVVFMLFEIVIDIAHRFHPRIFPPPRKAPAVCAPDTSHKYAQRTGR